TVGPTYREARVCHKQACTSDPLHSACFPGRGGGPCRGLVQIDVMGGVVANWMGLWFTFSPLAAVRERQVSLYIPLSQELGVAHSISERSSVPRVRLKRQHFAFSFDGDLIGSTT
ncbi:unnamed protein product, partial [Ectocarpus sp. 12 AP-2014]